MTIDDYHGSATSGEALAKYRRDGFALFPKLFSDAEVDDLLIRAMLHRGDERFRQDRQGARGTILHWSAALDPVLDGIRGSPILFDIVSRLLETRDIRQYSHQICYRDPGSADVIRWHRDEHILARRIVDPRRTTLAMALYLDDVLTRDQGAVLFAPGSHEWSADDALDAAAYERCEAMLPRRGMVGCWNAGTIHGSRPNRTMRDRRSLMHGYMRADASGEADGPWTWRDGKCLTYAEGKALG